MVESERRWTYHARIAATVIAALVLAACGGRSSDELVAAAQQHLAEGRPKAAAIELKNALQIDASSAKARFLLGQALLNSGDAAGAEVELERAAALGYPLEQVAPPLARALIELKEYKKLITRLGSSRFADAQVHAEVETLVGEALLAESRFADAGESAALALRLQPGYEPAVLLQARVMAASKQTAAAVKRLQSHLATAPKDAKSWKLLGELILVDSGDRAASINAFQQAAKAEPKMLDAYETLVSLHLLNGDLPSAQGAVDAARKAAPGDPRVRFFEAQMAFARNDFMAVRERLAPLLQRAATDLNLLRLAGAAEFKLGALSRAEQLLGQALVRGPAVLEIRQLLGEVYVKLGQGAKALEVLAPSLSEHAVNPEALALGGQAAMLAGERRLSLKYFEQALRLRPDDAVLRASVAVARMATGKNPAAVADLRRIAAADKGSSVDMALITALWQLKDYGAALKAVDALEGKMPNSPIVPNLRGQIQLRQNDAAASRQSFELALKRDADFLPAAIKLAEIDLAEGKAATARERFEDLIRRDVRNMPARLALAHFVARAGGKTDEVASLLNAAITADPAAAAPRLALIQFLSERNELKTAVAAAQAAVAALPASAEMQLRLGQILMSAGDLRQAISVFGKLAQQRPDLIAGHLGQADALIQAKEHDAAARSLQRALEIDPSSGVAQRMQVDNALRQRRFDVALEVAAKVVKQRPNSAEGLLLQGDVYTAQKNMEGAIAAYRKATQMPDAGPAAIRLHRSLLLAKKSGDAAQFADAWRGKQAEDTGFAMYLADSALANGDFASAERRYGEVLARAPEHPLALNNLAWLLAKQNKAGAVAMARRAEKQAPGQPTVIDTLAMALSSEQQHKPALEMQMRLVAAFPENHAFRLNLARILLKVGAKSEAIEELERLERVGPAFTGQPEVKRLLGRSS